MPESKTASPSLEVELKLTFSQQQAARLRDCPALQRWQRDPLRREISRNSYYDSPARELAAERIALRVREQGGRCLQHVKARAVDSSGLQARPEWEWPLDDPRPRPELAAAEIDNSAVAAPLAAVAGRLTPIFGTHFERASALLEDGANAVELCIDSGHISAAGKQQALFELELELQRGSPAFLYRVALALLDHLPLRIATDNKAQRGLALYATAIGETPPAPQPRRRRRIELRRDWSAERALQMILRDNLGMLLGNRDCALRGDNPEGIHQSRVALRRLRSALSLFRDCLPDDATTGWLRDELKWLAGALAAARDWDVFLGETLPATRAALGDAAGGDDELAAIRSAAQARRSAAYREAAAALESPRATRLLLRLGQWLEGREWRRGSDKRTRARQRTALRKLAGRLLQRRWKKLRRRANRFATLSIAERHALRIDAKKMRYACDFFSSLYPRKQVRRIRRPLARMQSALGQLNDIAVTEQRITELQLKSERQWLAAGRLLGWRARSAAEEIESVAQIWRQLDEQRRFWR